MDGAPFATLIRSLTAAGPRRRLLAALLGGALAGLLGGTRPAEAGCDGRKLLQSCKRNRQCCTKNCVNKVCYLGTDKPCADGSECCSGRCFLAAWCSCGRAGDPCSKAAHCCSGHCAGGECCADGWANCGGACVQCPTGGVCSGTSCVCPSGKPPCGGVCCSAPADFCCEPTNGGAPTCTRQNSASCTASGQCCAGQGYTCGGPSGSPQRCCKDFGKECGPGGPSPTCCSGNCQQDAATLPGYCTKVS